MARRPWLALVLGACGTAGRTDPPSVRDSAGVAVVENPALGPEPVWQVDPTPLVDIGTLEGEPEYQLFRVTGAIRLADGRIAVANSGTGEVRFYRADGRFVRAVGRDGEGPGEFRAVSALWRLTPESLFVADNRLNRISVFDTAGNFARAIALQLSSEPGRGPAIPTAAGVFSDGTFLVARAAVFSSEGPLEGGAARETVPYFRFSPAGRLVDTLGTYPDLERLLKVEGGGFSVSMLPFGKSGSRAVCGDGFYYGSGDRYEIGWRGTDGALRRLVRREHETLRVTPADVERYRSERLDVQHTENDRRAVERRLADVPFPDEMPAHGPIRCDDEAYLWVQEYRRPGDEAIRWSVFDPEGRLVGWVRTPDRLRVTDIGRDFVLGTWTDDLDVQHVRLHRLRREW